MCNCIHITYQIESFPEQDLFLNVSGTYNGRNYWQWTDATASLTFTLWWDTSNGAWTITTDGLGGTNEYATIKKDIECPIDELWKLEAGTAFDTLTSKDCSICGRENRYKEFFTAVRLPKQFEPQNRGYKDCCCEQLVLAGGNDTWSNDKTAFWIKLSDGSDTCTFQVVDENENVIETYPGSAFPNESNAYYQVINWSEILGNHGAGCYYLSIEYNIAGIIGTYIWGLYKLKPYSIENALKTARVRAIFNGVQEIDGINFTGSNVESTHRFYGYIGNRQPNMEIDNIIYDNREMKRVIRENLNDYEILTDPLDECNLRPLTELYLISENELYISDYNAHNHSYRYLDLPVIVQESPELTYYDFSRKASLKCKVGDKFKNQRTFY